MKLTKFHLFIILALALILCPVLGVCYNSNSTINAYNYSEGFENEEEQEEQEEDQEQEQEQEQEEQEEQALNEGFGRNMAKNEGYLTRFRAGDV
jgi:hypothetical protein